MTAAVVVITGVASGIGRAQAQCFLNAGWHVHGIDCQPLAATSHPELCQHPHFWHYHASVCDQDAIAHCVAQILTRSERIDALLNTAGVLDGFAPTLATDRQLWQHVFDVNVTGAYIVTNAILPQMIAQKKGAILNMASIAGLVAGGGGAAYTASKHALIGYTKQVAADYADAGIRVNALAPGAVQTAMTAADFAGDGAMAQWVAEQTPLKRWAQPAEIAQISLFLVSEQAAYIHGAVLPVDGGWTLS